MTYTIDDDGVRFHGDLIARADPTRFEILEGSFARDSKTVFASGFALRGADPATFEVVFVDPEGLGHFGRDRERVFKTNPPRAVPKLDGARFVAVGDGYGSDGTTVFSFHTERALHADPGSFEALGGGWAKDAETVYCRGRKVRGALPESFEVVHGLVGRDARRLFLGENRLTLDGQAPDPGSFRHLEGGYFATESSTVFAVDPFACAVVPGVRPDRLEVLADDYAREGDRCFWAGTEMEGVDPRTFRVLTAGFALDALQVYERGNALAKADPSSFRVVAGEGEDDAHRFSFGRAIAKAEPIDESVPAPGELAAAAAGLLRAMLGRVLPLLDHHVANEQRESYLATLDGEPAEAPELDLEIDGDRLVVDVMGHPLRGSFAGILGLAGAIWGASRGRLYLGRPAVRMIEDRCRAYPEGRLVVDTLARHLTDPIVDVAHLLYRTGDEGARRHARAMLMAFFHEVYAGGALGPQAQMERFERLKVRFPEAWIEALEAPRPSVHGGATTNLAAVKAMHRAGHHRSPDAATRRAVLEQLHGVLWYVDSDRVVLIDREFDAYLPLLDDPDDHLRDLAVQCLDSLVTRLYDVHAYDRCLRRLAPLLERSINVEVHLARRWVCESALGRRTEAEATWSELQAFDRGDRFPQAYPRFTPVIYPDLETWTVDAHRRLAVAYSCYADGEWPCPYEKPTRARPAPIPDADVPHLRRAREHLAIAVETLARLRSGSVATCAELALDDLAGDLRALADDLASTA